MKVYEKKADLYFYIFPYFIKDAATVRIYNNDDIYHLCIVINDHALKFLNVTKNIESFYFKLPPIIINGMEFKSARAFVDTSKYKLDISLSSPTTLHFVLTTKTEDKSVYIHDILTWFQNNGLMPAAVMFGNNNPSDT